MKIKPGDKFKTRDGREVEIDRIDTKGTHPVFGRVKVWQQCNWTVDGKFFGTRDHELDITIPPERKSRWLNWYVLSSGGIDYRSREEADRAGGTSRTHVLEIITENGEPVEVKIHKVAK